MKRQKDEKWLDELISRTINTTKPEFDPEKWKQKYPEEFQIFLSRARQLSPRQPNMWRTIFKSPITKLATAAVIIVAIGLFIAHRGPGEQPGAPKVSQVAKSPAEMLTALSLERAFRQGGIEAVEDQCRRAFRTPTQESRTPNVQELLTELGADDKNFGGENLW